MKRYSLSLIFALLLLMLTGCAPGVGFGIGGSIGGPYGGTEVLVTEEGVHGSVAVGGDFVH
jgi:hypothetical protein